MRIIFCTTAPGEGIPLLRALLDERLVACGNIIPGVRSLYKWKGKICDDAEELLIMETDSSNIEAKINRIAALHKYDVPKILAVAPVEGLPAYLKWAAEHTGTQDEEKK